MLVSKLMLILGAATQVAQAMVRATPDGVVQIIEEGPDGEQVVTATFKQPTKFMNPKFENAKEVESRKKRIISAAELVAEILAEAAAEAGEAGDQEKEQEPEMPVVEAE